MITEIEKIINQYSSKSFGRIASCRPELLSFLKNWNQLKNCKTVGEQFFCIHNNINPPNCICGKKLLFNTFEKGYRSTCGDKKCRYTLQSKTLSNFWVNNPEKKKEMIIHQKETCIKKYGYENIMQNPDELAIIRKKLKDISGYSSPLENPMVQEKCKATCLKNIGVERPFQSEEIREKANKSFIKNHGQQKMQIPREMWKKEHNDENPFQDIKIKQKCRKTTFEKYGVLYASQNENIKKQILESGIKTNLSRYGVASTLSDFNTREKIKKTILKKYGVENFSQKELTKEALEILLNKNLFELNLQTLGVSGLAKLLNVYENTIYKRHHKYNLNIIQSQVSSYEIEIETWLTLNNIQFERNTRKIISPLELDFYLPEYNMAIEFNGLYWHSESIKNDKNYHFNKTEKCNKQNIRLIHIFEDEWLQHKQVCLDLLSRFLNINQQKIFGRKCKISEIDTNLCKQFLNENHIQGHSASKINIGLFFNNTLIQVMTFKHSRYNKNIEWENIRCCSARGYQIIGGTQKLWSYFQKTYNPNSVISYCDKRWFTGETYKNLGFNFDHFNRPQYSYTDYRKRWHRSSFTKKKCLDKINNISENKHLTEKQITLGILELDRIWDCGQNSWIWKK